MSRKSVPPVAAKPSPLHPRNRHQQRYDFAALTAVCPDLAGFIRLTPKGNHSIDFTDPQAIKALNRALLQHWYQIENWDIPAGYLCPPIPGRADYIHYLADLLATANGGKQPAGKRIQVLDIGCGANCIYPLIGSSEYGWQFVAADIEAASLASAERILAANPALQQKISLRQQPDAQRCFTHIVQPDDYLDLTLCNPPFHESVEQMVRGNQRKWQNLGKWDEQKEASAEQLNFGGQSNELWCEGGELAFISRMMRESAGYASQVYWFTSLVSKQANLPLLEKVLKEVGAVQQQVVAMAQGQKNSRFIAWSFLNPEQQKIWRQMRWHSRV
ncbi:23S rRNA methyltransferase [Pokkaliibacter plantistimulans]|uniref:Ribosomal RNA large subunit methyltransferase F n=1 Tax=Pokkaliibacter plantistimulans TaxID=1635171 RepID=A0ABX5M3N5_9GAMM|nr:23S rRNA (adenine(1618)-N(6))-methyltransferase RlmF [Pokkaliibacter plantistimulans]PXF32196.1 23S rRNA methyltransferase [Pokkaliibacter plantistimulans]